MNKLLVAVLVLGVIAVTGISLWSFQPGRNSVPESPVPLSIGTTAHISSALIHIADNRSYFTGNGLNVTIQYYDSGKTAVDHLLKNDVDCAAASELIIVAKTFDGEHIRSIATISKTENVYLVGRTDRGIHNVSDLVGKKIGVDSKTLAEFSLGRFLARHGMSIQKVILVDITPSEAAEVLDRGDVDAVVTWHPYTGEIQRRMGSSVVTWPAQNSQPYYWSVISTEEWLAKNPDLARRFLQSLAQAEAYSIQYPSEAKAIVQERLDLDPDYVETAWPENQFALSLDQSLITAMEDEARWMIENNLTNATTIPDFRQSMYTEGLESVKPGAVRLL